MPKTDYSFTQNRELSWLKFNLRVLEEAEDDSVPLLEQLKYISIFTSNLDEFYMVRCGSLYDLSLIDEDYVDNKTGWDAQEQLDAIYERTTYLYKRRDEVYESVNSKLREKGIFELDFEDMTKGEVKYFKDYFLNYVFPVLSPQIIDVQHPFPHLANKSRYVMLILESKGEPLFGLINVPRSLPSIVYSPDDKLRYILMEKIVHQYVDKVFSNYQVLFKTILSVTRNADITLSNDQIDEDEDYRGAMTKILKKRTRLAPIRLEFYRDSHKKLTKFLRKQLNLKENQVQISHTPLDMAYVYKLYEHIEKVDELKFHTITFNPYYPRTPQIIEPGEILPQLRERDILLSYPYDSFDPFLKFLKEAANDKYVVSVQIAIYRLAQSSSVIKYLREARENGKDVTVLIELRARFDEERNIHYASMLEEAGCRVQYGFEMYKVHSKICLVTRKEGRDIQYFTQLGTGNYNEKTARLYTDMSFLTSRNDIGEDAMLYFKNMSISNINGEYDRLLVAPFKFKSRLIRMMEEQIEEAEKGRPASIIMKMNSLTDREMIDMLSKASNAGVEIKLIIRGICCIIPGLPGKTEHIEVTSIVGRFLEHHRIYCFGTGEDAKIYLSSGDLMTRNTEKRVEIAFPVDDPGLKDEIRNMMEVMLSDNVKARKINTEGDYERITREGEKVDAQRCLMQRDYSVSPP
jgi:polyphosphate kinase